MKALPLFRSNDSSSMPIGGTPDITDSDIPKCRECNSTMKHVFTLDLENHPDEDLREAGKAIQVFQCQNDPGMCDDWDAESGANAAYVREKSIAISGRSDEGLLLKEDMSIEDEGQFIKLLESDAKCIGKMGGDPMWIQGDETPACDCGNPMRFVAQVDERACDDFNFGGAGCSYSYMCPECKTAKFLWQS